MGNSFFIFHPKTAALLPYKNNDDDDDHHHYDHNNDNDNNFICVSMTFRTAANWGHLK